MIELFQFPWSPYCIVQRRILEFAEAPFRLVSVPNTERSIIWKLTRERYHAVPIIRDGRAVVFETDETSQVIAKYLNEKFQLRLFPQEWRGVQTILWGYIENEVEGLTFRLNDIYWREFVPKREHPAFVRHKERKFGRGCLDLWKEQQEQLLAQLAERLVPFEQMLVTRLFLLDARPCFVDFDLYGMLANFLYSGHYQLPAAHTGVQHWFERMSSVKTTPREKLRTRYQRSTP